MNDTREKLLDDLAQVFAEAAFAALIGELEQSQMKTPPEPSLSEGADRVSRNNSKEHSYESTNSQSGAI